MLFLMALIDFTSFTSCVLLFVLVEAGRGVCVCVGGGGGGGGNKIFFFFLKKKKTVFF